LLDYDATDVEMVGPNATGTRISFVNEEWRRAFDIVEAGAQIRVALVPKLTGRPVSARLWVGTSR